MDIKKECRTPGCRQYDSYPVVVNKEILKFSFGLVKNKVIYYKKR